MQRDPSAVSLETFVLHSLSSIAQETSGRAQAQKDVREAAIKLLEELGVAEFGRPGSRLSIPFPADVTSQLLAVLRGALALGNPRLAEPALSCMHKLVAYAYLQGETASNGRLDDDNVVTQVVGLTARCGESNSAAIQLQVVKALLTYVTAEHFMAHGDVLMQAIRAVFNTAIGAESADIKNTARSALLQMINTVLKRVGQQILSPGGTPLPSPAHPAFRTSWSHSSGYMEGAATAASAALAAVAAERAASVTSPASPHAGASGGEVGGGGGNGGGGSLVGGDGRAESGGSDVYDSQPLSPAENTLLVHAISQEMTVEAPPCSTGADVSPNTPQAAEAAATAAAEAAAIAASAAQPQVQPQLGQQPSADMAEAADMAAAAADMAELQAALPRIQTSPPTPTSPLSEVGRGGGGGGPLSARRISVSLEPLPGPAQPPSAEQFVAAAVQADARTAQLASLAEQSDLRGLERALDSLPQADPSGALSRRLLARQETPPDPRRALMRDRRASTWRMLTPVERDALIVLTAMSKMASRETGFGAVESYLHQGKLLALDLLVRVLTNPTHDWSHMRPEFAAELRHPLCLVLLRNCTSPYELAGTAAVRLFEAILSAQKLRAGLKAELGALYPLLLLKPIEAAAPDSPHAMVMAAEGLLHVCSHPQVLVDLFVNYDCSLQAANLYERTIKAVRKLTALQEPNPQFSPAVTQKLKATALKALLAAIQSLDTWAGPIKSAAAAVALTPEAAASAVTASHSGELSGDRSEGGAASPLPRDREELQRILADKELKDALLSGIQAFNQNAVKGLRQLVQSGVIADGSPAAAARFLREHAARLDKGQVGELMGHHEDHSVQVMHCYIDSEHFGGLKLDEALRRLLGSFRLPGEAQKIDRIMEKFAERFCKDNPAAFKTADGAYLLAFAIIMLNTDAHNPMADRRISADDFVSMAQCQVEGAEGEMAFEQILPSEDLLAIYRRITEGEIKVAGEEAAALALSSNGKQRGGSGGDSRQAEGSRRAKLAAAVGVTQMVLPFWSGATWDKQHGVDVERKRLLEFTRQMVAASGGAVAGNIWHTATHAEHARPMMQVSGDAFLQCLNLSLEAAPNMHVALQILGGYERVVRLAALLRLESICEALVSGLAAAAGLAAPAPHSSAGEAKQVAALSKLVSLGSCSEAGMLGSSWLVLLRALSQLERLQATLLPGSKGGLPPLPEGAAAMMASSSLDAAAAAAAEAAAQPAAAPPPPPSGSGFGRLLQRMGLSGGSGSSSESTGRSGGVVAGGPHGGLLAIKDEPGAGHVLWAETAGVAAIERLYTNSSSLHGDAVLSFMRALCAVSQEELQPNTSGERPRVGLLQKVVECAYHNMPRIRIVWSRLWGIVAQHLVSAACHTDAFVAMYAVDALRQLAAKLLDRAELARFTHQGEALRPFAAVLRHSDSPAVRELAVACVAHAASAHPGGLGSGWRSVLEALALAAGDSAPAVVSQALDALQPVVEALFRPAGHVQLCECVAAVLAGVENPHGFDDLSINALHLFQALARRLEEALASQDAQEAQLALHSVLAAQSSSSSSSKLVPAAAARPEGQPSEEEEEQQEAAAAAAAAAAGTRSISEPPSPQTAAAADGAVAAWHALLVPLATVARTDARPHVADAAAAVLMQLLRQHAGSLSPPQWQHLVESTLLPLLALPAAVPGPSHGQQLQNNQEGGSLAEPASSTAVEAAAAVNGASGTAAAAADRRPTLGLHSDSAAGEPEAVPASAVPAWLSFEGLDRVERHASTLMPNLWQLVLDADASAAAAAPAAEEQRQQPQVTHSSSVTTSQLRPVTGEAAAAAAAAAEAAVAARRRLPLLWQPLLSLLLQYVSFPAESAAVLGVNQLHQLLLAAAPVLDAASWQAVLDALHLVCLQDPWAQQQQQQQEASSQQSAASSGPAAAAAAAEALRRCSRLSVLLQRVVDSLLQRRAAAMPGQVQLQLLELLHRTILAAADINASTARRIAADRTLAAGAADAAAAAAGGHLLPASGSRQGQAGSSSSGAGRGDAAAAAAAADGQGSLEGEAGLLNGGAGALSRNGVQQHDGSGSAAAAAWEQLLPALVRQEAEGGCLYIASLQRCVRAPAASNGTQAAVVAECEARLAAFCLWVVKGAAARVSSVGEDEEEDRSGGGKERAAAEVTPAEAAAAALAAALAASSASSTAMSAPASWAPNPADQAWDDAVRAPLVDAALQAYSGLSAPVWRKQQAAAFPHLARLVCSPSRPVRRALKVLLQQHVPSVLAATA